MDGHCRQRHVGGMPAPITKLSDRFADYILRIKCRRCGHERTTEPHSLAQLLGWEILLTTAASRMRCSKCGARGDSELTAIDLPKSKRGRRSN